MRWPAGQAGRDAHHHRRLLPSQARACVVTGGQAVGVGICRFFKGNGDWHILSLALPLLKPHFLGGQFRGVIHTATHRVLRYRQRWSRNDSW